MMARIFLAMLFVALAVPGCRADGIVDHAIVPMTIVKTDGETIRLDVEMAIDPETQRIGLMYRKTMPENAGMLFIFQGEMEHFFWMKDTLLPLDLIYIRKDGTIHSIHENAVPLDETPLPSKGPVNAVLEINGGAAKRFGIKPGDKIKGGGF